MVATSALLTPVSEFTMHRGAPPSPPTNPTLEVGAVHLWMADVATAATRAGVLSDGERRRASRFRFERDRTRWVGAHVLQRVALASYLPVAPERLHLEAGPRDKPRLRGPTGGESLEFNLSHAGDLALVAVADRRAVGVDVEVHRAARDLVAIARRVLGNRVADELDSLPAAEQRVRFYQLWVRHEARMKCLGSGVVEPGDASREPLTLVDLHVGDGYTSALAVAGPPPRIRPFMVSV